MYKMSKAEVPKLEVQWSPVHKSKFITWGPDIRMYEVINTVVSEGSKSNDTPKGLLILNYLIIILLIKYHLMFI